MSLPNTLCLGIVSLLLAPTWSFAQDRETKVRNDKKNVEADESWVYNDLEKGIAEARKTGKPLLVVFRCIPCEACSKFDDQVVRREPAVKELMDKFVCVRIVQANSLDMTLFQYDYDQSFSAFLMNADKTIYARFGTRSANQEETLDMNIIGFGKALSAALEAHSNYPANKAQFAGKLGPAPTVKVPEEYPSLRRYGSKLNYEGNVVQSCMHCHQVREAERLVYRNAKKPIPESVLYPYPNPAVVGMTMDSDEMATIKRLASGSTAEKDGFKPGDRIVALAGQPLFSIADFQWVLHNAPETTSLKADVLRNGKPLSLQLTLDAGWRRRDSISWRATSWDLRRMATGGLVLEDLPDAERREIGLPTDRLALRVKYVGQYNEHAAGKNAGFQKDDLIVAVPGASGRLSESDFLAFALSSTFPGQKLPLTVKRGSRQLELQLPMQ